MSFEPRDYLRHILVEADYLIGRSADLTFAEFAADETLRRAFVRSLEIIGEAAKKVPDEFRTQYPAVELGTRVSRSRLLTSSRVTRTPGPHPDADPRLVSDAFMPVPAPPSRSPT